MVGGSDGGASELTQLETWLEVPDVSNPGEVCNDELANWIHSTSTGAGVHPPYYKHRDGQIIRVNPGSHWFRHFTVVLWLTRLVQQVLGKKIQDRHGTSECNTTGEHRRLPGSHA
jgi:hypothetical protein